MTLPHPRPSDRGRGLIPEAVVGCAAVLTFGWAIDGATPWRDELVTLVVADRPVDGILDVTRRQDLVHLAYYLLVHPLLQIDHGITVLRVLSVLAVAATAVVLVRIGRALAGWPVGLSAGLLLVASATASRYAQEARSFPLVALLVATSTLALVRAGSATEQRHRSAGRWTVYAVLVVLIGVGNLLGLLGVAGHAVYAVTAHAPRRAAVLGRWLLACAAAAVVLSPFVVVSWGQAGQVSWLQRPGTGQLTQMLTLVWTPAWAAVAVALVACLAVVVRGTGGARRALALGLGWGALPPLILWAVSQSHPLYHEHYLFPQAAGLALAVGAVGGLRLAGTGTAAAGSGAGPGGAPTDRRGILPAAAVALVPALVLGLAGLPQQRLYRERIGHGEDVPAVAEMLTAQARPGDAIVYLPYWLRLIAMAYPLPAGVEEVALDRTPQQGGTITGDVTGPDVALERLAGRCRVWVVTQTGSFSGYGPADDAEVALLESRYDQVHKESKQAFDVMLFRLRGATCAT